MKRAMVIIVLFMAWTLVGAVSKVAFMAVYHDMLSGVGVGELLMVVWNGVGLDMAIAVYMCAVPLLLLLTGCLFPTLAARHGRLSRRIWQGYFVFAAVVTALAYVANIGLYGYWNFPLDSTPIVYVRTSPKDAMASLTTWQLIGAVAAVVMVAVAIYVLMWRLMRVLWGCYSEGKPRSTTWVRRGRMEERMGRMEEKMTVKTAAVEAMMLVVLGGLLIIPLRGGTGTGTIHVGSVYFSDNMRLNHAAVNPVFCFVESVLHQKNDSERYHFMDDEEMERVVASPPALPNREGAPCGIVGDGVEDRPVLKVERPDIMIICLESFSREVMKAKDRKGNDITPCLNALTKEGLYFRNFYANSFRTDRAMVSILSALPAQPTATIMDNPHKSNCLPSLARSLKKEGYVSTFYYGGDTNFSNMRSYFVGTGFENIVSETSFAARQRVCKWGVPDEDVYERMLREVEMENGKWKVENGKWKVESGRRLRFMMTESSHEPYDVPRYNKVGWSEELNAFAYADSCLGDFMGKLKKTAAWERTLVIIVPDHLGVYPEEIDNYRLWRYQLPMIMTGGVISENRTVDTFCCQTDIVATVLGMMGLRHDEFVFSHDVFSRSAHYGFFTFPDGMGLVDKSGYVIIDNNSRKVVAKEGGDVAVKEKFAKALVQKVYKYIDKLE